MGNPTAEGSSVRWVQFTRYKTFAKYNPSIPNDDWVMNLKPPKKRGIRKIMGWFSRKTREEIKDAINELKQDLLYTSQTVDKSRQEIAALRLLVSKEFMFIHPNQGSFINKEWVTSHEARDLARKDGYKYVRPFNDLGELWIKGETK